MMSEDKKGVNKYRFVGVACAVCGWMSLWRLHTGNFSVARRETRKREISARREAEMTRYFAPGGHVIKDEVSVRGRS